MHGTADDLEVLMADEAGGSVRSAVWGDMATNINHFAPGTDFAPLLAQLSTKACSVPHWGYVIEGSVDVTYLDGSEETISAGEVYYMPAGHNGFRTEGGATLVEVSPADGQTALFKELASLGGE
jgi:hypothetical protein